MKVVCDGSPVIHRVYRKEKDWSVVDCLNDACGGILYHLSNRHTEELKDNPNPYAPPEGDPHYQVFAFLKRQHSRTQNGIWEGMRLFALQFIQIDWAMCCA